MSAADSPRRCFGCTDGDESDAYNGRTGDATLGASNPALELLTDGERSAAGKRHYFDVNLYATKKSAANGLFDLALLMANASQLKHILLQGDEHEFYIIVLALIVVSIVLQLVVGVFLLVLAQMTVAATTDDEEVAKRTRAADSLNNWIVAAIFVLTIVNVFISAFGLNEGKMRR